VQRVGLQRHAAHVILDGTHDVVIEA